VLGEELDGGPLTAAMKTPGKPGGRADIRLTTHRLGRRSGSICGRLERRGIAPNVALLRRGPARCAPTYSASRDVQPTAGAAGADWRGAGASRAMEGGGGARRDPPRSSTAPMTMPKTARADGAGEASPPRCGGIYSVHMRSEGDRLIEAVQETIDIARTSGAPAEIYHPEGRRQTQTGTSWMRSSTRWRRRAQRGPASPRTCTCIRRARRVFDAAHGLPWVQDGGLEAWITRLKDPAIRTPRVGRDARSGAPPGRNLYGGGRARPARLLLGFKNPALKPLTGKTAGGSGAAARREPRRRRDRPGGAGRFARRGSLFPSCRKRNVRPRGVAPGRG